jgi:hypothetical protein
VFLRTRAFSSGGGSSSDGGGGGSEGPPSTPANVSCTPLARALADDIKVRGALPLAGAPHSSRAYGARSVACFQILLSRPHLFMRISIRFHAPMFLHVY